MPGRVFVTGGSGFVGAAVIGELLRRGYAVIALSHRASLGAVGPRVQIVRGDLFDAPTLEAGMAGCDAVIHLVGVIKEVPSRGVTFHKTHVEGTRSVLEACRRAGVRRYVHMSALGTRAGAASRYHKTKHAAEVHVRASGLEWTVIRPSLIHGSDGEFMRMEVAWARKRSLPFLFMPYFGSGVLGRGGAGKLQPVFVDDVARAFADALEKPQTIGKVYELGGPDVLTWPELHHAVAEAVVGRRRWVMPIPVWYAKLLVRTVPARLLPFNRDQVVMSGEDATCDLTPFITDFAWCPRPFRDTLATYAKRA